MRVACSQATFQLEILGVKKNPQSTVYTSLGVITQGTVLEVNVSELGLVTNTGKVVWGTRARPLHGSGSGVLTRDAARRQIRPGNKQP